MSAPEEGRTCAVILILTCSTPGRDRTAASASAFSRSLTGHAGVVSSIVKATALSQIRRSLTNPRVTISRCKSGSWTRPRALSTCSSVATLSISCAIFSFSGAHNRFFGPLLRIREKRQILGENWTMISGRCANGRGGVLKNPEDEVIGQRAHEIASSLPPPSAGTFLAMTFHTADSMTVSLRGAALCAEAISFVRRLHSPLCFFNTPQSQWHAAWTGIAKVTKGRASMPGPPNSRSTGETTLMCRWL